MPAAAKAASSWRRVAAPCAALRRRDAAAPIGPRSVAGEEAAEDAVISQIQAGLEVYATEQLLDNGRRSWPDNPWDGLDTKPNGYTTDVTDADEDGEWTYNTTSLQITHQRRDNSRFSWDYDKGVQTGDNADVGTLGDREDLE